MKDSLGDEIVTFLTLLASLDVLVSRISKFKPLTYLGLKSFSLAPDE